MSLLKNLKLNLILALSINLLLSLGLLILQRDHDHKKHQEYLKKYLINYLNTLLHETNQSDSIWKERIEKSHLENAVWLHIADDSIVIDKALGTTYQLQLDAPDPLLVRASITPQAWIINSELVGIATPINNGSQIVYAEFEIESPTRSWNFLAVLTAVAITLFIYMFRRIYLPIKSMQHEAEAALRGNTMPDKLYSSSETAAIQSSVSELAKRIKEQDENASRPDPR